MIDYSMELTGSYFAHKCSLCAYTTNKKYNLTRHITLVHKPVELEIAENVRVATENVSTPTENVSTPTENVSTPTENVSTPTENVSTPTENVSTKKPYKCETCYKCFARKYNLEMHKDKCKQVKSPMECKICHAIMSCRSALTRHQTVCTKKKEASQEVVPVPAQETPTASTNIQTQQNAHQINNNVQQQTNIILNFPDGMEDETFEFSRPHIKNNLHRMLEGFWRNRQPKEGYARYQSSVLDRPENRIAYKTSPNIRYMRVMRDGQWEWDIDDEVFETMSHHMTTAAIADIHEYKDTANRVRIDIVDILRFLDDVNTQNEANTNYEYALDKLKVKVLNLSQRLGLRIGE